MRRSSAAGSGGRTVGQEEPLNPRGPDATTTQPDVTELQRRAFAIYRSRAGAPGDPLWDWIQAERELQRCAALGL